MISNHRYNEPRLIRIWFDWWFYRVYAKVQINQRWWFLAWRHPSTEILTSENHLNRNTFTTQQWTFAKAKQIYWCICIGTSE